MSQSQLKKRASTTFDTKSGTDKRSSRTMHTQESEHKIDGIDNQEKAFLYLIVNICQELIQLHNDGDRLEVEMAIKDNQTYEQVACLVRDKLVALKRDYVTSEYQLIQMKETLVEQTSQKQNDNSFEMYAKLQEQNMRWKQLYFQEARTLIDMSKSFRQSTMELEQQLEYSNKVDDKMKLLEHKYLQLFENVHHGKIDMKNQYIQYANGIDEDNQMLRLQLQESRKQSIQLAQRLQQEIMKIQGSQELRLVDLQYIMNLENKCESME